MTHLENFVLIKGNVSEIFAAARNIEGFPRFVSCFIYAKTIGSRNGNEAHKAATRLFGIKSSWESALIYERKDECLSYEQLKGFCAKMKGDWFFSQRNGKVAVRLTHDYEVSWPLIGWFLEKTAVKFYMWVVSEEILKGLKKFIETS